MVYPKGEIMEMKSYTCNVDTWNGGTVFTVHHIATNKTVRIDNETPQDYGFQYGQAFKLLYATMALLKEKSQWEPKEGAGRAWPTFFCKETTVTNNDIRGEEIGRTEKILNLSWISALNSSIIYVLKGDILWKAMNFKRNHLAT